VCVVALIACVPLRAWRGRVLFAIVALLLAWVVSDFFKAVFHRARPADWQLVHESSTSYSSGHATLTVVVYGLWAYFLWNSSLPRPLRLVLSGMLVLWCLIVAWSRLAMGAHYPTDIAGGWLLAAAVLLGLRALVGLRRKAL
jgi:undecaprenyl-diphosphatase